MKRVSILNLNRWIFQREIIRLILGKLNRVDWKMMWAAHNKKREQQLITDDKFFGECLAEGCLEVVKWLYAKNPRSMIKKAHKCAAVGGHLHIIKWLKEREFMWYRVNLCELSALHGHLEMLKWAYNDGCSIDWYTYRAAAAYGHLEILKWLVEKYGTPSKIGINWCLEAALMQPTTSEYLKELLKE
jgi:hypothetical protein